jgi:hypothetical protein
VAATGGARLVELQLARQLADTRAPSLSDCLGHVQAASEPRRSGKSSPSTSSPTPRASARIGAGWNQRPLPGRTQSLQTRLFRIRRRIDLRLFGRHRGLRESPAPAGYLRGFPCGMRAGSAEAGGRLRPDRQQKMLICREFTGATGLEPATSGVTGRSWWFRDGREFAGITAESRAFWPWLSRELPGSGGSFRRAPAESVRDVLVVLSETTRPLRIRSWSEPTRLGV